MPLHVCVCVCVCVCVFDEFGLFRYYLQFSIWLCFNVCGRTTALISAPLIFQCVCHCVCRWVGGGGVGGEEREMGGGGGKGVIRQYISPG